MPSAAPEGEGQRRGLPLGVAKPALDEEHDDECGKARQRHEGEDGEPERIQQREVDPVRVDELRPADRRREQRPERRAETGRDRAAENRVQRAVRGAEDGQTADEPDRAAEREPADLEAVVRGHADRDGVGREAEDQHHEPAAKAPTTIPAIAPAAAPVSTIRPTARASTPSVGRADAALGVATVDIGSEPSPSASERARPRALPSRSASCRPGSRAPRAPASSPLRSPRSPR